MVIRNLLDRHEGRPTESLKHHRRVPRWHMGLYWRPQRTVEETCNQGVSAHLLSTKRGVVGRYCRHINLQGGVGHVCADMHQPAPLPCTPCLQALKFVAAWKARTESLETMPHRGTDSSRVSVLPKASLLYQLVITSPRP